MKVEERKIRFGVVGCGHIGKRHAEMIMRNEDCELVAMADIRSEAKNEVSQFGVQFYNSIEELIENTETIDVLNVCTPNGYHREHSIAALNKGMHVVCEKPMALTKAGCEEIIFKSLQVSKQVFCVMQNRYSPPSVWIKDIIEQRRLGSIYMVQVNCYWNRDKRYYKKNNWKGKQDLDGGTLFTQFSHFIDIMYWLFGDIKDITGNFKDFNHQQLTDFEDSGMVNFNFVNGGMGCINYSTSVWNKNLESSLTIIGEKGSVKIGGQYMNEVEYCDIDGYEMPELEPSNPANDYGAYKGSAANHHYIIENVVDSLKGKTSITTNALEGLKVVEIIERIYELREEGLLKKSNNK